MILKIELGYTPFSLEGSNVTHIFIIYTFIRYMCACVYIYIYIYIISLDLDIDIDIDVAIGLKICRDTEVQRYRHKDTYVYRCLYICIYVYQCIDI